MSSLNSSISHKNKKSKSTKTTQLKSSCLLSPNSSSTNLTTPQIIVTSSPTSPESNDSTQDESFGNDE